MIFEGIKKRISDARAEAARERELDQEAVARDVYERFDKLARDINDTMAVVVQKEPHMQKLVVDDMLAAFKALSGSEINRVIAEEYARVPNGEEMKLGNLLTAISRHANDLMQQPGGVEEVKRYIVQLKAGAKRIAEDLRSGPKKSLQPLGGIPGSDAAPMS